MFRIFILVIVVALLCCSCGNENANNVQESSGLDSPFSTSLSDDDIMSSHPTDSQYTSDASSSSIFTDTNELGCINASIKCVSNDYIEKGCFFDFDKDGIPELISFSELDGMYAYGVYDLKGEETRLIGWLNVGIITECDNALTLYRNMSTGGYFYYGVCRTVLFNESKSFATVNIHRFNDNEIITEELAYYRITSASEEDNIYVTENRFLGEDNVILNNRYYNENELIKLLGVEEYLSQFEMIEVVNLEPLWNQKQFDDGSYEQIIREYFESNPIECSNP